MFNFGNFQSAFLPPTAKLPRMTKAGVQIGRNSPCQALNWQRIATTGNDLEMSYTGTIIDNWCKLRRGNHGDLCNLAKIQGSGLSRLRSGDREPTYDIVSRIARVWPDEWKQELAVAWLRDSTPESLRQFVTITTSTRAINAPVPKSDLKKAFDIVVAEAEHNRALQQVIVNLAQLTVRMGHVVAEPADDELLDLASTNGTTP